MKRKSSSSDVYDVEKRTGALIIGKNRLDDFATNYLKKYCPEALKEPIPLPVYDILEKNNLVIEEAILSPTSDIFGCCMLLDGNVKIFNEKLNSYEDVFYKKGTILIDPNSDSLYGEITRRNILIHEAIHWDKDKTYFDILKLKNTESIFYPIMCRTSERHYQPLEGKKTRENQLKWLEWQAHRLTPRILMPKNVFIKKAKEILNTVSSNIELVQQLSDFFIVSKSSVKYRLIEVDLKENLMLLNDFDDVFSEIYGNTDYIPITQIEAVELLEKSKPLKKWVNSGKYIFVEGYFVIADPKNIELRKGSFKLSPRVKANIRRYVINIQERIVRTQNFQLFNELSGYLCKVSGPDKRLLIFAEENQFQLDKRD